MNYSAYLQLLFSRGEKTYAEFSQPLSNSNYTVIGVRIPILRQLVKTCFRDEDLRLSDFKLGQYLEVDFSYLAIGLLRCETSSEQLAFLSANLQFAQSWVLTDMINSYLKQVDFASFWEFFQQHLTSKHLYVRRFVYVFGLKFYRDQRILQVLSNLQTDDEYLVYMGQAWLLATVAICYSDAVYEFLKDKAAPALKSKTIAKIRDSYRINQHVKQRFIQLRQQNK